MAIGRVFPVVIVSVALSGCTSMPPPRFGPSCNAHECHVAVAIADCKISAVPDAIGIARGNGNVEMHWDITTAGYAFSDEGIVFSDDPRREFQNPRRPQPTKFMLNNKHSFAKDYKYTINIKASTTCPALTVDPWVVNE